MLRGAGRRCLEVRTLAAKALTLSALSLLLWRFSRERKKVNRHQKRAGTSTTMVKTYNKYEASRTFGLVNSSTSNVLSVVDSTQRSAGAGQAVVGACEDVYRWDLKTGELLSKWKDGKNTSQVTAIARSAVDVDVYAVGYVNTILGFLAMVPSLHDLITP